MIKLFTISPTPKIIQKTHCQVQRNPERSMSEMARTNSWTRQCIWGKRGIYLKIGSCDRFLETKNRVQKDKMHD
ncbi:hypothetical protein KIN20_004514 [Parelaphostrongylus tenuis]|uniref:Uncharacterized protein n=1 Tax=Parelaphostrongylus tenuis TaxID=148309 RepID=A0AAD5M0S3_PARTN|nr:hypothetical protein KIN20_004514 [Parelaphostrongylus tenuis]